MYHRDNIRVDTCIKYIDLDIGNLWEEEERKKGRREGRRNRLLVGKGAPPPPFSLQQVLSAGKTMGQGT